MMAATQPFLSGAISKTVNLPNDATVEDVAEGLRGGVAPRAQGGRALPRRVQGVAAALDVGKESEGRRERTRRRRAAPRPRRAAALAPIPRDEAPQDQSSSRFRSPAGNTRPHGLRVRLPKKRIGFTQEARVGGHKIFLRTGEYEDGTLGEIFIDMHKEGAAFRSLMNCFAMSVSHRPAVRRPARDVRRAVHVHALRAAGARRGAPVREVRDVDRRLTSSACSASNTCTATTSRT
jgi:ribonucleoside-diphosphate reductase alpha chain